MSSSHASEAEVAEAGRKLQELRAALNTVLFGQQTLIDNVIVGLLARGHLLLEGLPGLGKTELVKGLARVLRLQARRVQFTPDLLPGDITGNPILQETDGKRQFVFQPGPLFANLVLADEINRASPKTQSALLECMEEGQVTADLRTHQLPHPFFVIATQNPTEYEGVYPLPESQLDRFAMRLSVGYPDAAAERMLMKQQRLQHPIETLQSVTDAHEIQALQACVREVTVHDEIYDYVLRLAHATRAHNQLVMGLSPRGALILTRAAQAHALIRGRDYVAPDDVKAVAVEVISHRLVAHPEARLNGFSTERLVEDLLRSVPVEAK